MIVGIDEDDGPRSGSHGVTQALLALVTDCVERNGVLRFKRLKLRRLKNKRKISINKQYVSNVSNAST